MFSQRLRLSLSIAVAVLAAGTWGNAASADVIFGPTGPDLNLNEEKAEAEAQPAPKTSSENDFFARLGVRIIGERDVNPPLDKAPEMVEELIEQGCFDPEELVARVRAESPVVIHHLVVDLSRQRLFAVNRDGKVLDEFKVSTGMPGYETPPGEYRVVNRARYAYSKKYEADMYNWMGLTRDGGYGIHSLKGSGYERRLGHRASHGCIRLSRKDAQYLFPLIPLGTTVRIVNRLEPLERYQPISDEDLRELIAKLLGTQRPVMPFF
ncbi:MAG: hypothetical protein B1H03_04940 [Planctomycetales bacterium 4484_113]|nr:MAG: hypothetical protein B1H03_04940 [Planctomycetales bacterium 4484_113]